MSWLSNNEDYTPTDMESSYIQIGFTEEDRERFDKLLEALEKLAQLVDKDKLR